MIFRDDGERQLQRLKDYCAAKGYKISQEILEIGSGLNGHRKKLLSLLADVNLNLIVIEHRDRLTRFGFDYIETVLNAQGRTIEIINEEDMIQDFIDVVTCFCASIYGKRSAENKAQKDLLAIEKED